VVQIISHENKLNINSLFASMFTFSSSFFLISSKVTLMDLCGLANDRFGSFTMALQPLLET
jgi:hypothetical protein